MTTVSVVLNAYGRPEAFQRQLQAVREQSIAPAEVLVWRNPDPATAHLWDESWFAGCICASSSFNFGVWSRFFYALNARSEYVAVFDDDTIPGRRWLENCVHASRKYNGMCGTNGVIFNSLTNYRAWTRVGWRRPNKHIIKVDIVGHCWFLRREWLGLMCSELPERDHAPNAGEDFHASYMLQKHGIPTLVPRHPRGQHEWWGSLDAVKLGRSGPAISRNPQLARTVRSMLPHYIDKGFRLLRHDELAAVR